MDNPYLIGLLIVAGVLYKIYESFKEEQAKAKSRMEKLKKQAKEQGHVQIPIPQVKTSTPENIFKRPPTTFSDKTNLMQEKNKEEVWSGKKPTKPKRITLNAPELEILDKIPAFDLRQAIIQQAILNRPYQN